MEAPPWAHAHIQQLRLKLYPQGSRYAWVHLMGWWDHCYQDLWAFLGNTPMEEGGEKASLSEVEGVTDCPTKPLGLSLSVPWLLSEAQGESRLQNLHHSGL